MDPAIFEAMIQQESGFREGVGSSAGAQDIAQFIPSTAKAYGVTLGDNRVTDDLEGAARYLRDNLRRTGGSYAKALSIYNSGSPTGYQRIPETINYVKTILGAAGKGAGAKGPTGSSPSVPTSQTVTTPGVDNSQARRQALAQFLLGGTTVNPATGQTSYGGDILQFALAMRQMGDVPGTTQTTTSPASSAATTSSGGAATDAKGAYKITGPNPGRIKPLVRNFLGKLAGVAGHTIVGSDGTGHSKYTTSGNVSEHFSGNAIDIPSSGPALTRLGQQALIAAGMPEAQARKQTGGLFNLPRPGGGRYQIIFNTMTGGNHFTHLHVGAH